MKYFYQQLFGFLSVVLVTIVACGILFYNVMSNNIYTQRSQQLQSYAKGIIASEMSYADIKKINPYYLNVYMQSLYGKLYLSIKFSIFLIKNYFILFSYTKKFF